MNLFVVFILYSMYASLHLCSCCALQSNLLAKMTCTTDVRLSFHCFDFNSTNSTHHLFYCFTHTTFSATIRSPFLHTLLLVTWWYFALTQVVQCLHSFMFGRITRKVNGKVLMEMWEVLDMFVHVLKLLIRLGNECNTVCLDLSSLVALLTSFQSVRFT